MTKPKSRFEPKIKPGTIKPSLVEPPAGWNQRPLYNGAELRPFDGRPGAMNAYKLPSKGACG